MNFRLEAIARCRVCQQPSQAALMCAIPLDETAARFPFLCPCCRQLVPDYSDLAYRRNYRRRALKWLRRAKETR